MFSFLFCAYREAIVFLTIAFLSVMGLANSVVDDESCDSDNDDCEDWDDYDDDFDWDLDNHVCVDQEIK